MIRDWIKNKLHQKSRTLSNSVYASTLTDCFEMANSEVYTRSQMMLSNRAYDYFKQEDKITHLADYLSSKVGLDKFQYIGCGDNAIVVRYSENQALRFRAPAVEGRANTQKVLQAPFISPVWKEIEFMGGRLNFVPFHRSLALEIISGRLEKSDGNKIIHRLIAEAFQSVPPMWFYDYFNYDYKYEQVAILDDWTPLIIDQGGIIFAADAPPEYADRIKSERESALAADQEIGLQWDGFWMDETETPKINGLEKPKPEILQLTGA